MNDYTLDLYDYHLPPSSIAQKPLPQRDQARLLVDMGSQSPPKHLKVADLPDILRQEDVVVLNDARVLKARLRLQKQTGGKVEVLALQPLSGDMPNEGVSMPIEIWEALVRPSRRVPPGATLFSAQGTPLLLVGEDLGEGRRKVWPVGEMAMADLLEEFGEVPLPPYITTTLSDSERYQTVFADQPTAVAAPTAGLHLTPELLLKLKSKGITIHSLNLAVGLGTFRPITTPNIADHLIHEEHYQIPDHTWQSCLEAKAAGNRVVAVGTTVVRALEAAAFSESSAANPLRNSTDLYIFPGFQFRMVDALLTNFHLPRSTLLLLLAAFMGGRWRQLYELALKDGYRFLSFGDAMFCTRQHQP